MLASRRPDEPLPSVAGEAEAPFVVCLLPARNCAHDLPDYFRSVSRFADAVIALDDGSSDDTRAVLRQEPLVRVLLNNPRRETYAGWDDAGNRNRLLEAAAELNPRWVISLDADERFDHADALSFRAFIERDALPGLGYGFRVHRMVSRTEYDRADLWAYRLFRYEPGQRFPDDRLHLVPIPTSIPADRFVRTTFRIQHVASETAERRRRRYEKYRQADARNEYQQDYGGLLAPPTAARRWQVRSRDAEALEPALIGVSDDQHPLDAPILSAVIIAQNDERTIEDSVRAALEQDCGHPFEVIVVTSGTDATAEVVRRRFPTVRVVELREPALPGRARNVGLELAEGEFVSFPGSHVLVEAGSFRERIRAHESGYTMVTGSIINATRTRSGWASYFLDHSTTLPTRPSGELHAPPAHCSYEAEALRAVGGFPEDMRAGEDTIVNERLWSMGYRAFRAKDIRLVHRSPCALPTTLIQHHFQRGRAMSQVLMRERRIGQAPSGVLEFWLVRYGGHRFRSVERHLQTWGDEVLRSEFERGRRLIVIAIAASWVGIWFELCLRRPTTVARAVTRLVRRRTIGATHG